MSARYLATVLFPHPAGPVTSQMWCSVADEPLVDAAPLASAGGGSRVALGDDGTLWRPVEMAPDGDGCPFRATEVLYESMVTASGMKDKRAALVDDVQVKRQ